MWSFFFEDPTPEEVMFTQHIIINNYNHLAQKLKNIGFNLNILDNKGVCGGLTLNYLFFAKEGGDNDEFGRRAEFYDYLEFISSLTDSKVSNLIERAQQKKIGYVSFFSQIDHCEKQIKWNGLIDFLKVVSETASQPSSELPTR